MNLNDLTSIDDDAYRALKAHQALAQAREVCDEISLIRADAVRRARKRGVSIGQLASLLNVTRTTIQQITKHRATETPHART